MIFFLSVCATLYGFTIFAQAVDGYLLVPRDNTYQKVFMERFEDDNTDTDISKCLFCKCR